jgi:methylmalonyl-CoA mutase cobalamin-binding subunit
MASIRPSQKRNQTKAIKNILETQAKISVLSFSSGGHETALPEGNKKYPF